MATTAPTIASTARHVAAVVAILAATIVGATYAATRPSDPPPALPSALDSASDLNIGRFDELPRFPRSAASGPPRATATSIARDFVAADATPTVVLEFYDDALVGWARVPEDGPHTPVYTRRWTDDQYDLRIAATATTDANGSPTTSFTVELRDR